MSYWNPDNNQGSKWNFWISERSGGVLEFKIFSRMSYYLYGAVDCPTCMSIIKLIRLQILCHVTVFHQDFSFQILCVRKIDGRELPVCNLKEFLVTFPKFSLSSLWCLVISGIVSEFWRINMMPSTLPSFNKDKQFQVFSSNSQTSANAFQLTIAPRMFPEKIARKKLSIETSHGARECSLLPCNFYGMLITFHNRSGVLGHKRL